MAFIRRSPLFGLALSVILVGLWLTAESKDASSETPPPLALVQSIAVNGLRDLEVGCCRSVNEIIWRSAQDKVHFLDGSTFNELSAPVSVHYDSTFLSMWTGMTIAAPSSLPVTPSAPMIPRIVSDCT